MCESTLRVERARYASLTRSRTADDPELIEARRLMQEQSQIRAVKRALEKPPPISPRLRERILALLSTRGDVS